MRDIFLIFVLTFGLVSCDDKKSETEINTLSRDTLAADSSLIKTNSVFLNPFRDINNFDVPVNCAVFDSLYQGLSNTPGVTSEIKRDICAGDNCTSFKTLKRPNSNTTLHLFKHDSGEYGFSNDQFILSNDSIKVARNFLVGIETWPSDSNETVWAIQEQIFYFYPTHVKSLERRALTTDLYHYDFTLKDSSFDIKTSDGSDLFKTKSDELKGLLTLEPAP